MSLVPIQEKPEPVELLVPRDGDDRPIVVPASGGKPIALTRTTTFIDCIEDKSALATWGKRSVLVGAVVKHHVGNLWEEVEQHAYLLRHGNADDQRKAKRELDKIAERLMDASGANDKREKGTYLHALSELVDKGKPLPDSASRQDVEDMAAYMLATLGMDFLHAEEFVVCEELAVGGTPDRICMYAGKGPDGKPIEGSFIFDLKTGNAEYGGLKFASQLGIYAHSQFYDARKFPAPPYHKKVLKKDDPEGFAAWKAWDAWRKTEFDPDEAAAAYSPIPPVNQDWGIILHLPSGTGETTLYWADLRIGWEAAKLATVIRRTRQLSRKALIPFA